MKFRHPIYFPAIAILAAAIALPASSALAAPQPLAAAESCTTCHGVGGNSSGAIPTIAGKEAAELISDLEAFRSGEMSGSIMGRLVGGLTEAEIDAIARYFASIAEGE